MLLNIFKLLLNEYPNLTLNTMIEIKKFTEKDPNADEWINGGFMVMEPKIFNFLKSDEDSLEFDALENLGSKGLLGIYKHSGFWKCMDSLKDKMILNDIWNSKKVPWKK